MLLKGKSGLVTAAGSGIGRASALALATQGANVMVSDINDEFGLETVRLIKEAGGVASYIRCDVSDEAQVRSLVKATVEEFGRLDFAHNNAGLAGNNAPLLSTNSDRFDFAIKINIHGLYYALKAEIEEMIKTGGGSIINTISCSGLEGTVNMIDYTASKFGAHGMTKTAALEYGKYNIRVNGIAPGMTLTPAVQAWKETSPEQSKKMEDSVPMGRLGNPEEQANGVVFLASDLASYVTGIILPIDGGYMAGSIAT